MNFKEYYVQEALGEYFPTVKKAARMLSPKSIAAFGQSMAPEYQKQFAVRPEVDTGESIFAGKTMGEIQAKVLKWRTKHITDKDDTIAAENALNDLKSAVGDGHAPAIRFFSDFAFTDANYIPPGSSRPKEFSNIGHYANTVFDSMLMYAQRGYPLKDTRRFLRYDPKALEVLEKHGYLYTG
jgi:hypothetical protein